MADKFQLKALITGVDKLSPMLTGVRKNALQLRKQLRSSELGDIGFSDMLKGGAFAAPFIVGAREAMRFESAMADVRKVVDFDTPAQFQAMNDQVLDLSEKLPMAANGIAAIVAAGGQSGLAREELMQFAEDAVKMGVAFDTTAEQSGEMMAKWRTSFRMNQAEVVTLADQINHLGNKGAASVAQISKIVTAIGPLGEVAGVSAAQIAAMGSTLAGVGINDDVAATGIKNLLLTLTAGGAASKAQQQAFKALRLDSKEVAKGMQTDAEGTIARVLKAVSKVEKSKQASVLTQLFQKESVGAIAPLMTNLEALSTNFRRVGDASEYAGSMNAEYAARAKTTENNMQLLQNRVTRLGISVGSALLPPFNEFMDSIGPVISGVAQLAAEHPELVKGVLGAAVGFGVLRVAVMGVTAAMTIMAAVTALTPIGIAVRALAFAAGLVIANWATVGPYFMAMWEWVKGVFVNGTAQIVGFLTAAGGQIVGGLTGMWNMLTAIAEFTPLGMIIKNWEPIVAWMRGMWERIKPYVQPIMDAAAWVMGSNSPANGPVSGPASGPGTTSLAAQAAAANGANLQGQMVVRFENAPAGMRADPAKTNQSGLLVTPQVGYRSLSGG